MITNSDIIIAFYFEDLMKSVSSGIPDATMFRWRQNAKAFGVTKMCMIDITTFQIGQYYQNSDAEITFERYQSLSEVETKYPQYQTVALETPNTLKQKSIKYQYLPAFKHPDKALYVVGADTGPSDLTEGRKDKKWVVIPSDFNQAIWAETAMSIVLYDRYLKTNSNSFT